MLSFSDKLPIRSFYDLLVMYSSKKVIEATGATYRQLDRWVSIGLVKPSVRNVGGKGNHRFYGFEDLIEIKSIKQLRSAGVSLKKIRKALDFLRAKKIKLTEVTFVSDGNNETKTIVNTITITKPKGIHFFQSFHSSQYETINCI